MSWSDAFIDTLGRSSESQHRHDNIETKPISPCQSQYWIKLREEPASLAERQQYALPENIEAHNACSTADAQQVAIGICHIRRSAEPAPTTPPVQLPDLIRPAGFTHASGRLRGLQLDSLWFSNSQNLDGHRLSQSRCAQ